MPWEWSGGATVLGKLPVPGRPTIFITVGQGPTALAVGAGGGCLDIFALIYPFSSLTPGGGRVERRCWVNFQCRGVLLNLHNSRARAYCAGSRCGWGWFGHCFSHLSFLFSFYLSLGDGPI